MIDVAATPNAHTVGAVRHGTQNYTAKASAVVVLFGKVRQLARAALHAMLITINTRKDFSFFWNPDSHTS